MTKGTRDVIVVGSGQAGVPLATRLADAGRTVVLIERGALGGTCVNVGCTPTKTMVASARAAHVARHAARLGVHAGEVRVDLAAVVERKDALVQQWREGVTKRVAGAGDRLTLVRGHARFVAPRTVDVNGARYQAETVIVNTGARPAVPAIPGLDGVPWLDNATVMELRDLPDHLVVIGGGFIGCEFGQMFRRFGAAVTILGSGPHLLGREDEEISTALEEVFLREGITLRLGARPRSVAADGAGVRVELGDGGHVRGSHLLVATGRVPNSDDLGCAAGDIELRHDGAIAADAHYRTSARGVYAVGDVIGGPQFTHTSWDDHRLLFDHLAGRPTRPRDERLIPSCTFTDPQVARVGLSEREARERDVPYEVATLPFGSVARAIELDEKSGIMKALLDPTTERFLGVALVGYEAGELLHVFVNLMEAGAKAATMLEVQHVHPTLAEGLQTLVRGFDRYAAS